MPRVIRGHSRSAAKLHDLPLDGEEQQFLDDFLRQGVGDLESFMELDGFITALVVVPGPQMPASWHGVIFGGMDDEDVLTRLFAAEARGILALVLRHWRTVRRRAFATGRWTLPEDDEDTCIRESDWAEGFLDGISRTEEEWGAVLTRDRCDALLVPVRRVAELPLSGRGLPALSGEQHAALELELVLATGALYLGVRGR